MNIDKKRRQEIDQEMAVLVEAMKVAMEQGDWKKYEEAQKRYAQFLNMHLAIRDKKKDEVANKVGIAKIIVDSVGILTSACVGLLAIFAAVGADQNDILVNNRAWNVMVDIFKFRKR